MVLFLAHYFMPWADMSTIQTNADRSFCHYDMILHTRTNDHAITRHCHRLVECSLITEIGFPAEDFSLILGTGRHFTSFSHSELKCARAHVVHVYFRLNFRLGPRSQWNELSKLPSQQLGSPGYYDRCHVERNDLICYSQYYQTFCHVKQTSHLMIFGKSGRLFYWATIWYVPNRGNVNIFWACCHCYWCRFFVIGVANRYYIVERCCYMCIFMLPIVHGLQTPSEHFAIWGGFFSFYIVQSFKFLNSFFLSIFRF